MNTVINKVSTMKCDHFTPAQAKFFLLCIFTLLPHFSYATPILVPSCEFAQVKEAITQAPSGSTLLIAPGDCTWVEGIVIDDSKKLTIFGSGVGVTTIRHRIPNVSLFDLKRSGSRISNFSFIIDSLEMYAVKADGHGWRVDHNRFESEEAYPFSVWIYTETPESHPTGLIDNCEFVNSGVLVAPYPHFKPEKDGLLWESDLNLGWGDAVFIEDSRFTFTRFGEAVDANYGGRFVFRHNIVTDTMISVHSVQGGGRAARSWEIYDNKFEQKAFTLSTPFFMRGGTGVIYNNSLSGSWGKPYVIFDNVRDDLGVSEPPRFPLSFKCRGGAAWDGNQPIAAGGLGTHRGASGSAQLQESSAPWGTQNLVGLWAWNLTSGTKGVITANTSSSVTAIVPNQSSLDSASETPVGTALIWQAGDAYKISDGYPCRDQIGRGKDLALSTITNPNPPQSSEPVYIWNNTYNDQLIGAGEGLHIKRQRDFVVGIPRPAYVPYTYPHPLQAGVAPQSPGNLRVN